MDDLDLAINGLWLGGLKVVASLGLLALCLLLLRDLLAERTRDWRVEGIDLSLVLAAGFIVDAELDPYHVPIGLFVSFLLLGVVAGRRWQRAESRHA